MSNTYDQTQLTTVLGVPKNVATATQKVEQNKYAKFNDKVESKESFASDAYSPNLIGISTFEDVVKDLRGIKRKDPCTKKHWLNYYLSYNFHQGKPRILSNEGLSINEFSKIALDNYSDLLPDSKLNFAKFFERTNEGTNERRTNEQMSETDL